MVTISLGKVLGPDTEMGIGKNLGSYVFSGANRKAFSKLTPTLGNVTK